MISSSGVLKTTPMQMTYLGYPYVSTMFLPLLIWLIPLWLGSCMSAEQVATVTRRDTVLSKVYNYVQKGWPQTVNDDEKPYWRHAKELSTQSGCLLWGNRVIIPGPLQNKLIDELHQNYPGIARMKSTARSYFWWLALDRELEEKAQSCIACQSVKNSPASAPLHPWLWPAKPWQRVHIDFAGPFMNRTF